MKRSREGNDVVAPDDLRQRVLQEMQSLVSPVLFQSLAHHSTEALMSFLAQIRAAPVAADTDAAGSG